MELFLSQLYVFWYFKMEAGPCNLNICKFDVFLTSLRALGPGGGQISRVVHVSTRADGRWGGAMGVGMRGGWG